MPQYAWLELHGGMWNLLTDKSKDAARKWVYKNIALAVPKDEGLVVSGPYPKRLAVKETPRERFYGYGLMRTVH